MTLLIAHRGASNEAPENTRAALLRAREIGVDLIEIDVHLTADEQLVVIHDSIIGRTAWGAAGRNICEMTLSEVQTLDAGSWFSEDFAGETIPTLAEVLAMDLGSTGLMIEVKRGHCPLEPLAAAVIKSVAFVSKIPLIIGSFSAPLMEHLKELNSTLPFIGIVQDYHLLDKFEGIKPQHMAIYYKLATPSLIATFQEKGAASMVLHCR